jgi:predicted nucleic acid-binding protein
VSRETLICDTSFVGHFSRQRRQPARYVHWDEKVLGRVLDASLAMSVVTIGEMRAGYRLANWESSRIADAEQSLQRFYAIPVRRRYVGEWARLRTVARTTGIAISDNDLWVAATASRREEVLVTCDRDHLRIADELPGEVVYLAPG